MTNIEPRPEVQARAVDSLFQIFEEMCDGAVSVDRNARIVWINEKYRALLGIENGDAVLGRDIEEIIPESLMRRVVETGKPVPVDIMQFGQRHFVVSRLPLHGEAGDVIGAIGFVLYDSLDYLKPMISKFERLSSQLSSAEAALAAERRTRYSIASIVGTSRAMGEIKQQARRLAQTASPVLLLGETGTGKELLAQSIHAASDRATRPFVAVNMAAVPETLLESEFFGVAPGAYTGAERRGRKGKFEIATSGTLFLDEIGDLPGQLQAKLLRVLEEQVLEPLGANEPRRIDVRVIAATSQDLPDKIARGAFRKDLYYRLNVLPITIPPLRERSSDIRPLAEFLLDRICAAHGSHTRELAPEALTLLEAYPWPGNVRELRNILEQACLLHDGAAIGRDDVLRLLPEAGQSPAPRPAASGTTLPERVADLERDAILDALRASGGKKSQAARALGIARSTLYEKLEEYQLSEIQT
ncbi:MAG: sigma 54-interacting transcriptional regulator [Pseudomonadota bacterium]